MRVNIYYGGRGLIDDPTLYVLEKITKVLDELRVTVERYNLYEDKRAITVLPKTLKEADGVILAASLEWFGFGGFLHQFLDACWLYGDKEKLSHMYMMPVVMATTYGEREAEYSLIRAWEMLGGVPGEGICAYVDNHVEFEMNAQFGLMIEKKTENFYRMISKKAVAFPNSSVAVKRNVLRTSNLSLTPQESEQLSQYVSDDNYVKKQKQDIEELSSMFRGMMGKEAQESATEYIMEFQSHFAPQPDFSARYLFMIGGKKKPLFVGVDGDEIVCHYGQEEEIDVYLKVPQEIMDQLVRGQMTFQRAFSVGDLTTKGNFKTLRMLDDIFTFTQDK